MRLMTFIITLIPIFPAVVYSQCDEYVICTLLGPPYWTYDYFGTGSGSMTGFTLYIGDCAISASAAPGFTYYFTPGELHFEAISPLPCGSYASNFSVTATGRNAAIVYVAGTSSGYVDGPYCPFTPTPSFTLAYTDTPTLTPTPVATATPFVEATSRAGQLLLFLFMVCIIVICRRMAIP